MKIVLSTLIIIYLIILLLPHYQTKTIINITKPIKRIYNVPLVIYRTCNSLTVPSIMYNYCVEKWTDLNPRYNILWFDNKSCKKFMKGMGNRIYRAYNKLKTGAYKADLWRACILFVYGGVYIDCYTTPFCSLSLMLTNCWNKNSPHQFISVKDIGKWGIHNGFMVCTAHHPFLRQYIADMVHNIEQNYYGKTDLDITGPRCLLKSINTVLEENRDYYDEGLNEYGELSFYLFRLGSGLYKPIYKKDTLILHKKYSFIHFIRQKWLNHGETYTSMWKGKRVYI